VAFILLFSGGIQYPSSTHGPAATDYRSDRLTLAGVLSGYYKAEIGWNQRKSSEGGRNAV